MRVLVRALGVVLGAAAGPLWLALLARVVGWLLEVDMRSEVTAVLVLVVGVPFGGFLGAAVAHERLEEVDRG